ncbi:hypothetical protein [Kamptonema formosum]|uniref:hypothetical protein n=1 Tax=Kamptonema formosum TaxID=331992 RepID=UPI0002E0734A|nr:hypothetical protein [Kamptonema formosum]
MSLVERAIAKAFFGGGRRLGFMGDRTLRDCTYRSPGSYCKLLGMNFKGNVTTNNTFVKNFPNK